MLDNEIIENEQRHFPAPVGRSFAIKNSQGYYAAKYKGRIYFTKSEALAQRWLDSMLCAAFMRWLVGLGYEDCQVVVLDGRPRETRAHLIPHTPPKNPDTLHSIRLESLFKSAELHEKGGYVRVENKETRFSMPLNLKTVAVAAMFLLALIYLGSVLNQSASNVNEKAKALAARSQTRTQSAPKFGK